MGRKPSVIAQQLAELPDAELVEAAMPHWKQLGKVLPKLEEPEVIRLLKWEMKNRRNIDILVRLHQRMTVLRARRERAYILVNYDLP